MSTLTKISRGAGSELSLEDIKQAIRWQRLNRYNCPMAKWIVWLSGHTKSLMFDCVKSKEVSGDFTIFKNAEGYEIGTVRTSRIDSIEVIETAKPELANRTPEELEILHKLVVQAERLGYSVALTGKTEAPNEPASPARAPRRGERIRTNAN
jgi:hypothetical protein